ncbi:AbrB/MazE/SpoVT family DNA-binding domain-containing protein [Nocardia grenadensis]|uniref:AbrB/MazE/SpoVT family DNA-binding domain-containing protein n=1 Tax=Nocardia grenadensis TaxID=931537 RepID=UPI0007A50DE0|nr:AbrB/MazE/SpoVT family DNA-binding domain-containing protein [Nocardia grenadensis]
MILESSGQITIPAALRAKFNLREGDNVEVVEIDGALVIVQTDDTPDVAVDSLTERAAPSAAKTSRR